MITNLVNIIVGYSTHLTSNKEYLTNYSTIMGDSRCKNMISGTVYFYRMHFALSLFRWIFNSANNIVYPISKNYTLN